MENSKKSFPHIQQDFMEVRNPISNAIKFSFEDGLVTTSCEKNKEMIKISVEDNGTGIDSHKIKNIFTLGEITGSLGTKNEKGTGLGLVLCKDFIELNHGKIVVESNPGIGSKFIIELPAKDK